MATSVFLLDDHEVVLRGLRALLKEEEDLKVVGEADTAEEALAQVPSVRPDVAILDLRLPDGDGIEVCRALREVRPELKCLTLSGSCDDATLVSAIVAGASGCVLKRTRGPAIIAAVRRVAAGASLFDPVLIRQARERLQNEKFENERFSLLTPRQKAIVDLLAKGIRIDKSTGVSGLPKRRPRTASRSCS